VNKYSLKGIEKIYNFCVNGLAKFGTQNPQNAIDLLLRGISILQQGFGKMATIHLTTDLKIESVGQRRRKLTRLIT
jgi:hypothetical protein